MLPITVADVEAAAARIAGRVHRTPVLRCASLDAEAGATLHLKAENLQRTGSFKARGAFNALAALSPEALARGVIALSSGNHAQAVALAAHALGTRALIVMPADASPVKVAATRAYGAEVVCEGVTADNREEVVRALAAERGLVLVHPFDDPRVMAGQGTVGLELVDQVPDLDAVVVPVGGGGLIAGVATAVKARQPRVRVVAAEPEQAADLRDSLGAGRRVELARAPDTVADALRARAVGPRPWEVIRRLVDEAVTVSEREILAATQLAWTRAKTVVEPSGAVALAAALAGRVPGRRLGIILSGGNVDPEGLSAARARVYEGPE